MAVYERECRASLFKFVYCTHNNTQHSLTTHTHILGSTLVFHFHTTPTSPFSPAKIHSQFLHSTKKSYAYTEHLYAFLLAHSTYLLLKNTATFFFPLTKVIFIYFLSLLHLPDLATVSCVVSHTVLRVFPHNNNRRGLGDFFFSSACC